MKFIIPPCFKNLILSAFMVIIISACGGGGGSSATQPKVNLAPTANANVDQSVDEQTLVTLSGSGSDSDGSITSYKWLQKNGTTVSLNDADSATAHFDAPETTEQLTLAFELTVTDNKGARHSDTVEVKVNPVNALPVADAGEDKNARVSELVALTGTGADTDGVIVSYQWTQLSGTTALLTNADTANLSFTAPDVYTEEILTFELIATDNEGGAASDTISITVTSILVTEVVAEITDANFASCLAEQTVKYANEVMSIICSERTISNVSGLEHFKSLTYLDISQNYYLSTVDVSANKQLKHLNLYSSINLKNIDLSNNHNLEVLNLEDAVGTRLDISNNPKLKKLYLGYGELEEIDLSNKPDLTVLTLHVSKMTTLDLTAHPNMEFLDIYGEELTDVIISSNTLLTELYVYGDKINTIDLSNNTMLINLSLIGDIIVAPDLSQLTKLSYIHLSGESLCDINLHNNIELKTVTLVDWFCNTMIDLSSLTNLDFFAVHIGSLDSLDLRNNLELTFLYIYRSQLTEIDLSQHTKLVQLSLKRNRLTNIDVSNNTLLSRLSLTSNQLTSTPIGLSKINDTNAIIDLKYNQFTDVAKSELEILKETYNNISY